MAFIQNGDAGLLQGTIKRLFNCAMVGKMILGVDFNSKLVDVLDKICIIGLLAGFVNGLSSNANKGHGVDSVRSAYKNAPLRSRLASIT